MHSNEVVTNYIQSFSDIIFLPIDLLYLSIAAIIICILKEKDGNFFSRLVRIDYKMAHPK